MTAQSKTPSAGSVLVLSLVFSAASGVLTIADAR